MDLGKLIVPSKTISAEFSSRFEGFNVDVAYLTRDELMALRKKATTSKFSKKTRQPEEEVDNELFQNIYIDSVIKGWSGLKIVYLPELLPVDLSNLTEEEKQGELEYSRENARNLMKNCTEFDSWITDLLDDVGNFTKAA